LTVALFGPLASTSAASSAIRTRSIYLSVEDIAQSSAAAVATSQEGRLGQPKAEHCDLRVNEYTR
jgi:hypothetical protein